MTSSTLERPLSVRHRADLRARTPRRVAALLVVATGLVLVGSTLANNLFRVGPAFESMIDDFRPILTEQSIATARQDVAGLGAVDAEYHAKLAPALAQQLGMQPAQFDAFVAQNFPAVDAGQRALPQAVPTFAGLIGTLDSQRPLFASADAIPTKDLPATTVPWGMAIAGLFTMGAGAYLWFSPRAAAVLVLVLGALLVISPLVMSLPGKAADADDLNANLKPIYNQQLVDDANATVATISAMAGEMQQKMLPALATQLKMTPAELETFLAANFPATANALKTLPTTLPRFQSLVATFDDNLSNYKTLRPVEFVPIVWTMIGAGIVLLALGIPAAYLGFTRS